MFVFNISIKDLVSNIKAKSKGIKNSDLTMKERMANVKQSVIEMVTDEVDEETVIKKQGLFKKDKKKEEVKYEENIMDTISKVNMEKSSDEDDLLSEAIEFVVESGQGSASMLQRKFKIGFNRAARLIDSMEERGIVGPNEGSKPRKVLMSKQDLQNLEGE